MNGRKYKATGVHTGSLIEKKLLQLRLTNAELARRINRSPNTTIGYYSQPSIQTAVLQEICLALNYNFFQHLTDSLPEELKPLAKPVMSLEPAQEPAELKWLREENAYLKKMIDVLAAKGIG